MDFLKLPLVVQAGDPKGPCAKHRIQSKLWATAFDFKKSLKDVIFAASDFGTQVNIRFQFNKHEQRAVEMELFLNLNDRFDFCCKLIKVRHAKTYPIYIPIVSGKIVSRKNLDQIGKI